MKNIYRFQELGPDVLGWTLFSQQHPWMNLKSLHKVKDEDLEVNRKHVVRGASIHISIHMSY